MKYIEPEKIKGYDKLLTNGDYKKIPSSQLLGDNGFIVILNEKNEVVYNKSDLNISLSSREINLLPEYIKSKKLNVEELITKSGDKNYQISFSTVKNDETVVESYILDENYHIIYASGNEIDFDLTEKEYMLLTQEFYEGYYISRYDFTTKEGLPHTLLLFQSDNFYINNMDNVDKMFFDSLIMFIIIYCILILGFILWLKRKINKPLNLLCNTFNSYEVGVKVPVSYRGPKEFNEIFWRFSSMASRLEESEKKRNKLENDKQKMLADITHDLKTPITVIQGYAKALNDGVVPKVEQNQYLSIIEQKASMLNELINTFYDYSKMEHPDYHLVLQRLDICDFFRDYIAEKYTELETAGFILEVDIPEEHIYCNIDIIALRRSFENIVTNAVIHNKKGVTLYFLVNTHKNNAVISIGDDGIGIPAEIRKHIFEPFVVGESSRSNHSSGLGLSISKRIIEAHKGVILLVDEPKSPIKTLFEIALPIV